jgi:uncharacterized protein (DUF58 family)
MKLYIIPSRFGLLASLSLVVMVFAGIVYANNSIILIAFLGASLLLALMIETHTNLKAIEFIRAEVSSGFAGQTGELRILLKNKGQNLTSVVELSPNIDLAERFSIGPGDQQLCVAHLALLKRGRHRLKRIRIGSTAPAGLFWAWGYVDLQIEYVVFPKPEGLKVMPIDVQSISLATKNLRRSGDDFSGHKNFETGHSWRHVDWKAVSRGRPWLLKDFQSMAPEALIFDFSKLQGDFEQRLSQLSLWVSDAHKMGQAFSLKLGNKTMTSGFGPSHALKCLEELGTYEPGTPAA